MIDFSNPSVTLLFFAVLILIPIIMVVFAFKLRKAKTLANTADWKVDHLAHCAIKNKLINPKDLGIDEKIQDEIAESIERKREIEQKKHGEVDIIKTRKPIVAPDLPEIKKDAVIDVLPKKETEIDVNNMFEDRKDIDKKIKDMEKKFKEED